MDSDPIYCDRRNSFLRLLKRLERRIDGGARISRRLSYVRLGLFTAVVGCVAVYQSPWGSLGAWLLPPVLLAFLAVVWIHSRLEHRIQRLRVWRTIKTTNLARHQLDWDALPPFSGEPAFGGDRHFYAGDIDITGRYGLLRLIDTTASNMGQRRLGAWLLDQNDESLGLAPWLTRQGLIRELAALSLFRDRITLEAALVGKAEISGERIGQLLEQPVGFKGLLPALWVLGILSVMTAVLLTLTFVMPFPDIGYGRFSSMSLSIFLS